MARRQDIQYILTNIDIDAVQNLPFNNDAQSVAAFARNRRIQRIITGRSLMERNVKREVTRILRSQNRYLTSIITLRLWRNCPNLRRQEFIRLAHAANSINRAMLPPRMMGFGNLMVSINIPQETRTEFESNLFHGVEF
ncbi:16518_t:CDS:1 [Funneliformis mosseae]|uniref:16518_t:CDS:1 n=1 Tax=Funneliformis mosseae TaxID=27381 RepID=A0A9N9C2X8_FUNMO|nr:16518_t:CDS:1 [Funneliformis mosseae]